MSQYHWGSLDQVRECATQWMWRYNHECSNMALGGLARSSGLSWPHNSTSHPGGLRAAHRRLRRRREPGGHLVGDRDWKHMTTALYQHQLQRG